jgi:NitT/TauT family transport system ATP-binding protein
MSARVELSGVTHDFSTGGRRRRGVATRAVTDVSLSIEPGSFVTLLGPSGCGKTTLLRIVAGLLEPTAGTVRINGSVPAAMRDAKEIGFVPQSPALLPWRTVRANASLLNDVHRSSTSHARDVDELLESVGLAEFADAYPHQLSGGMRQRVALARAFALGAPLLLMDEPFAALDEITRAEMRHLLARLREPTGATVVFVTHSVAEAAFLSDEVVVMTPRPGGVASKHAVPVERPRQASSEGSAEFIAIAAELSDALRAAGAME